MKHTIFSLLTLLCCLGGGSCKFFSIEPLHISNYTPKNSVVSVGDLDSVSVTFSAEASRVLAESAFSLEENGVKLTGKFEWSGNTTLIFRPFKPFNTTSRYLMSVSTAAEDIDGNSIEKEFSHEFRGLPDIERPEIIQITPLDNSRIDTITPHIEITFSEPMDRPSVLNGITFSPPIDGFFIESADLRSFTYRIEDDLSWQTWYTITIQDSVRDTAGNTPGSTQTCSFFTGTVSENLAIISVTATNPVYALIQDDPSTPEEEVSAGIEKNSAVTIQFSQQIDKDTATGNISITPAAPMDFSWNESGDELTISFSKPFVYNRLYTLSINANLSDIQGNTLLNNSIYNIRTNGSGSRPPAVVRADLTNSFSELGAVQGLDTLEPLMNITFPDELCTESQHGFIDVYISVAEGAAISPFQFLSAFSVSAENASVTPVACQVGEDIAWYASEFPPEEIPDTEVIRIIVEIDNSESSYRDTPGRISISLDSSFKDTLDNALPETWALDVYTTN